LSTIPHTTGFPRSSRACFYAAIFEHYTLVKAEKRKHYRYHFENIYCGLASITCTAGNPVKNSLDMWSICTWFGSSYIM